jgi:hypothetical protein
MNGRTWMAYNAYKSDRWALLQNALSQIVETVRLDQESMWICFLVEFWHQSLSPKMLLIHVIILCIVNHGEEFLPFASRGASVQSVFERIRKQRAKFYPHIRTGSEYLGNPCRTRAWHAR